MSELPKSYLRLLEQFPLRPLAHESELDDAVRMVDCLLDKRDKDYWEDSYLHVLSLLIWEYEEQEYNKEPPKVISARS